MVKLITVIKRRPGMELAAFTDYWRGPHGNLAAKIPGLRHYVQSQTIASIYQRREPSYDGIASIWFDDTAAVHRADASQEVAAVLKDEANFLDATRRGNLLTDEVVQRDDGPVDSSMVKLVEFVRRKQGMRPEDFHRHWTEIHGPLASKIPQMHRYVQSHVRPSAYRDGREPLFDGITEVWFASTDAMREAEKTPEFRNIRADEPNFVGIGVPFIITRERVIH